MATEICRKRNSTDDILLSLITICFIWGGGPYDLVKNSFVIVEEWSNNCIQAIQSITVIFIRLNYYRKLENASLMFLQKSALNQKWTSAHS